MHTTPKRDWKAIKSLKREQTWTSKQLSHLGFQI